MPVRCGVCHELFEEDEVLPADKCPSGEEHTCVYCVEEIEEKKVMDEIEEFKRYDASRGIDH